MKFISFTCFLIIASFHYGQESFTLEKAQNYALANNKEIFNAKLDQKIMEAKIWETTAQGLPQVNAEGTFQNFIDIPTQVLPANAFNPMAPAGELVGVQFGTNYNVTGGVTVSQLLFSGNYFVGLQAVKASSQIYNQLTEKKEIDIKFNVSDAFYTVLILKENKKTLESTLIKMKELLDLTNTLVKEEVMIRTNAYQLELSVLQIENGINTLANQEALALSFLKFQMGYPQEQEISVEGTLSEVAFSESGAISVESNIDYQILNTQLQLNNLSLKNTKANYLPTLAAFFNYQRQALRNDFDFFEGDKEWYPTTLWGLSLKIPIFSSGQKMAQVKQASIEVEKTENTINQYSEGFKMQVYQATMNYKIAQDKLNLQIKSQDFAQKVLDDTQILYKEGTVTSIELTQAQNQLITEQTNYTNALFELIKAKLQLEKLAQ
jgi:outer membrane protein